MSEDRELLEAAAKAAGISIYFDCVGQCCKRVPDEPLTTYLWNPIEDNYDAFALMVKLNLLVMPYPHDKAVRVVIWHEDGKPPENEIVSWGTPPDPKAATRRAIVRAAAAIGGAK